MKINETFNEGFMQNIMSKFAGPTDGSQNMSSVDRRTKQIFVQDFLSKAYSGLTSAIQSGRVDPSLKGMAPVAATRPVATSTRPTATTATNARPAAAATTPAAQTVILAGETFTKGPSGWVDSKGVPAPHPTAVMDRTLAQNTQSATATPAAATATPAAAATPQRVPYQARANTKIAAKQARLNRFKEDTFSQLNAIFESIILNEAESISSYLGKWLQQYARGIDISDSETQSQIKALLAKAEATWQQDQGKAALTTLANEIFASAPPARDQEANTNASPYGSSSQPDRRAAQPTAEPAAQPAAAGSFDDIHDPRELSDMITTALDKLQTMDPSAYHQLKTNIGSAP